MFNTRLNSKFNGSSLLFLILHMRLILRLAVVIVALAIAYLSLRPTANIGQINDKLGHFIAYFVLMFITGLAFWRGKSEVIAGLIFAAGYGMLMEVGQHFVPGRTFSILDMLANASGALLAGGFLLLFGKKIIHLLGIKENRKKWKSY